MIVCRMAFLVVANAPVVKVRFRLKMVAMKELIILRIKMGLIALGSVKGLSQK